MAPLWLAHYHAGVFLSQSTESSCTLAFSVLQVSADTSPWDKRNSDSQEVNVSSEHLVSMCLWLPLSLFP